MNLKKIMVAVLALLFAGPVADAFAQPPAESPAGAPPAGAPPAGAPPAGARQQPLTEAMKRGNELAKEAFRLSREGDLEAAIAGYRDALEIAPELHGARFALARLFAGLSQFEEARVEFATLVAANPQDVASWRGEATALILLERWPEARARLEESMRTVVPRDGQLAHLLARVLACAPDDAARKGSLALELAMWVYDVQKKAAVGETVAMAFAELGEYGRATAIQEAMVKIVEPSGNESLLALMRARLDAYTRQEPWRALSPLEIVQSTELPAAAGG